MSQTHSLYSVALDDEYAWRLQTTKLERQRAGDEAEAGRLAQLQQEKAINRRTMSPSEYSTYVVASNQREIEFKLERTRQERREALVRNRSRSYPNQTPSVGNSANARQAPAVRYPPIAGQRVPHIQAPFVGQPPIAVQAAPTGQVPRVARVPIAAQRAFHPQAQSLGGPPTIIHTAPTRAAPRTVFNWNVHADFRPRNQPATVITPPSPPRLQPVSPDFLHQSPPPLVLDESEDSGYFSLSLSLSSPKPRLDEDQLEDIEEWLLDVGDPAAEGWHHDPNIWGVDITEEYTPEWKWMPPKFR